MATSAVEKNTLYIENNVELQHPNESNSLESQAENLEFDTRAGWLVVAGSFFVHFVVYGTQLSFGVYYEHYSNQMFQKSSKFSLSLIGTLCSACCTIFGLFSGACADRYGYKFTMILGNIIATSGLLLASFSTEVLALVLMVGVAASVDTRRAFRHWKQFYIFPCYVCTQYVVLAA